MKFLLKFRCMNLIAATRAEGGLLFLESALDTLNNCKNQKKQFENPTFIFLTHVSRTNTIWGNHMHISNGGLLLVNISHMPPGLVWLPFSWLFVPFWGLGIDNILHMICNVLYLFNWDWMSPTNVWEISNWVWHIINDV